MAASILIGVQLLTLGLSAVVAVLALRQRHATGARAFGATMTGAAGWALVSLLQNIPLFYGRVVFSVVHRSSWIAVSTLALSWFAFGMTYTGRGEYLTPRRVAVLAVVPAITVFAAFCHGILIEELGAVVGESAVAPLWDVRDAWPIIQALGGAYAYVLVALGSVLLLEVVIERPFPHPGQVLMVLVVGPPWILNILQIAVFQLEEFNPTVLGFAVSGVAGLLAVGRFQLFDVPLARARVVEELDSGVLVYGQEGAVYDYNERAERLLSLSGDVLGTDVRTVLTESPLAVDVPADAAAVDTPPEATATTPAPVSGEQHRRASDGGATTLAGYLDGRTVDVAGPEGPAYVELRLSGLQDGPGDPPSYAVLLYDVSERERRKRDLEEKNEFLDEFTRVVSHDIATPLGVIENKARLVEVTGDPAHAGDIYEATERVQALVDELRDLAKEGVQVGETAPVEVETVAREAWATVETGEATLTVGSSRPVEADRGRLAQLFENVFDNAVEHTSDTAPVAVTVGTDDAGFFVADDGPGIPAERREQVFEQGHTTTEDGSGLGLAIVRRIAEGHGWTVTATESERGGARFEVDTGE